MTIGLLRPVHNTTLYNALHCVAFALTLVGTQHNARIDLNPILAFLCIAFLCQIVKKSLKYLIIQNFAFHKLTQGLASLCEPAFNAQLQLAKLYLI